jgi:hypothetical protein
MQEQWDALIGVSEQLATDLEKVKPRIERMEAALDEHLTVPVFVSVPLEVHTPHWYLSYQRTGKDRRWRLCVQKHEEGPEGLDPVGDPQVLSSASIAQRLAGIRAFPELLKALVHRLQVLRAEVNTVIEADNKRVEARN